MARALQKLGRKPARAWPYLKWAAGLFGGYCATFYVFNIAWPDGGLFTRWWLQNVSPNVLGIPLWFILVAPALFVAAVAAGRAITIRVFGRIHRGPVGGIFSLAPWVIGFHPPFAFLILNIDMMHHKDGAGRYQPPDIIWPTAGLYVLFGPVLWLAFFVWRLQTLTEPPQSGGDTFQPRPESARFATHEELIAAGVVYDD